MSVNVTIQEYKVSDFISIEHGTSKITMTFFNGRIAVGNQGWATQAEMTPKQAREVGQTLIQFANKISPKNKQQE